MIKSPKLLRISVWDTRAYAVLGDGSILPTGTARFELNSGKWHDTIRCDRAGLIVSGAVKNSLDSLSTAHGCLIYYEPYLPTLFGKVAPPSVNYYHWHPISAYDVQDSLIKDDKFTPIYRWIPSTADPKELYGQAKGQKSGCLYCTMAFVLLARKNRWSNFWFRPLDLHNNTDWSIPDFRINYLGKQWPPKWYPDGFEPHPNNLTDEVPPDPLVKPKR